MSAPSTLARRAAEPVQKVMVFVCALCRQKGMPLLKLVPTQWLACARCIARSGGREGCLAEIATAIIAAKAGR